MFEVGGRYANRKGNYVVLEVNEPKMLVRFDDGEEAELNMNIQGRIWENMLAEQEVNQSRTARARSRRGSGTGRFYVRPVTTLVAEELTTSGWKERVSAEEATTKGIGPGDRIIYYVLESQRFHAVVTITGPGSTPTAKDLVADLPVGGDYLVFPLDLDAEAPDVDSGVSFDAVEFESQPNMVQLLQKQDVFIPITEDEFELLTEILTEIAEEEEDDVEIEDDEEDEFED